MILKFLIILDPRNNSRYSRYSQVCCNDSRVSHKWENMIKPPLI